MNIYPNHPQGCVPTLAHAILRSASWPVCTFAFCFLLAASPPVYAGKARQPLLALDITEVRTAVVSGRDGSAWLRVAAKAWAPHPGYTRPRLVRAKSSSGDRLLRLRFLLDPPAGEGSWPMVLVEVEATALMPLGRHRRVQVGGPGGSVTVRIDPSAPIFPLSWGPPPVEQTKDWRPLPARYGFGSSTWASWIRQRLRGD